MNTLNSVANENQQRSDKITLFLGTFFGLFSSLVFASYNLAVKTWKLDFLDVLCVRSTVQIISFGVISKCLHQKFWPEKETSGDSKSYHFQGFLLIFQVRVLE